MGLVESALAIFAFGTLGFWIATLAIFAFLTAAVESESNGWLGFLLVIAAVLFGPQIMAAISVKTLLICVAGYLLAGAGWSLVKWWKYVGDQLEQIRKNKDNTDYHVNVNCTKPVYNKAKITAWIAAWPCSVFWTLLGDVFEYIYRALVGWYESISASATSEIEQIAADKKVAKAAEEAAREAARKAQHEAHQSGVRKY